MKVFVPTTAEISRLHTDKAFSTDVGLTWVFHTATDVPKFAPYHRPDDFIISNAENYIGQLRFINEQVRIGEWYIKADDNIRAFIGSDGNTLSHSTSWSIICEAINEAEKRGAQLVGFAASDKPMTRKKSYSDVGVCSSSIFAEKKTSNSGPTGRFSFLDGFERTAQHLQRNGRVLVCNQLLAKIKPDETSSGETIGNHDHRWVLEASALNDEFHGLFRIRSKSIQPLKPEITLIPTDLKQVEQWRNEAQCKH